MYEYRFNKEYRSISILVCLRDKSVFKGIPPHIIHNLPISCINR